MKPKILFWIDPLFIQFAIAKFLDEKIDAEFFAIYDFPSPLLKQSFENQEIIPFKKSWFFWDHVSSKPAKIDLNYLKHFEEKFNITLDIDDVVYIRDASGFLKIIENSTNT